MAKRARRTRSPHPGVKLKRRTLPSGRTSWRAHFIDPDTGREVAKTLDLVALPTHEARRQWAIQKSKHLARTRMDREAGIAPPPVGPIIGDAIDDYLETARARLRKRTLDVYRTAFGRLRDWASSASVERTSDLTRAHLADLRDHLVKLPKNRRRGGARRARPKKKLRTYRSAVTVNTELRALKTLINAWRRRDLTPQLSRDDIADALAALPVDREQPTFLRPPALRKLLAAALRHDAECFAETREEHAGRRSRGTTPRYVPIAPFIAFVLLSGCRRQEALQLRWDPAVDLDAVDHEGRKVGEIRLTADGIKTRRARTVDLEVSPALRRLLLAMKLRSTGARVFGGDAPYTVGLVEGARRRLMSTYGAPTFDWQTLRSTCGTYLTNAPGIFGAAAAYRSAKQLGHSVMVAERHYLGVFRGIPREARTLEAAMQVEAELEQLCDVPWDVSALL